MSRPSEEPVTDDATALESTEPPRPCATPTGRQDPGGPVGRRQALAALVSAYGGDTYRLLTDLADLLQTSVAYVDRLTAEAHLERPLSDTEWSIISRQFTAMAFDEHIGDAGTVRTDWIDDMVIRAGVPGRGRGNRSIGQPRRR
ncbi:hypothetical protein GCU67_13930 [Modestobacter muralis]|uniref:Uncharacterized protein n=1 Tax=Modestobacter muralis TaxID=1608614 RepID=A0A6P0H8M9_9ACTN|nr:hypothetical protein [Modestobacter muralis]NEK95253.1 hypothetical protein [Modestobacter muralis]NEN52141.1 hypothetical protein [Modestobacter muralis]